MNESNDVLLKVEHLSMFFGKGDNVLKAVNDVSFDIRRGEVFGLVGESGCGKTTTGRSIIKLYDITSGKVWFKGVLIAAGKRSYREAIKAAREAYKASAKTPEDKETRDRIIAENREKIREADRAHKNCDKEYAKQQVRLVKEKYEPLLAMASDTEKAALQAEYREAVRKAKKERIVTQMQMIFQDPIASLNPRMTVKEIISEGLIIKGEKDKKLIEEKVFEMLELVGLVREHASRYPHEFSGGQRQRIGIARAVIMKPDLLIADEPISALDVSIRAQVLNLLSRLRREYGLTYLFIAHDLSIMHFITDRLAVIHKGRIVELAETEKLFAHPLHPYTRALLSAIPMPDPVAERRKKLLVYDPSCHHYENDPPVWTEIEPGHFVLANAEENERYRDEIAGTAPEVI